MDEALKQIVSALDAELRTNEVPDYPSALNGLQLNSSGRVSRVAGCLRAAASAEERLQGNKENLGQSVLYLRAPGGNLERDLLGVELWFYLEAQREGSRRDPRDIGHDVFEIAHDIIAPVLCVSLH